MKQRRRHRRPNGSGCLVWKGEGRNYLARWTDSEGKVRTRTTGTSDYVEALGVLETFTAETRGVPEEDRIAVLKAQLDVLERRASREEVPLSEGFEAYKALRWERPVSEGTERNYRGWWSHLERFLSSKGCVNLSDVTGDMVEEYLRDLSDSVVLVSYNNRLTLFKSMWRMLSERGRNVREETWERFSMKEGASKESARRGLTVEEVRRLMERADDEVRLLIMLSYYTGQRCSDCCMLKWSGVDFSAGEVSLRQIKTGRDVTVHMSEELMRALLAWREATGEEEYVCPRNALEWRNRNINGRLASLFDQCGIERHTRDSKGRLKIVTGFHALRHTFASGAARSLSSAELKGVMGWSSTRMAEVYVHPEMKAVANAVESMEKIGA